MVGEENTKEAMTLSMNFPETTFTEEKVMLPSKCLLPSRLINFPLMFIYTVLNFKCTSDGTLEAKYIMGKHIAKSCLLDSKRMFSL